MDCILQNGGNPSIFGDAICPLDDRQKFRTRKLIWTSGQHTQSELKQQGFHVVQYGHLKDRILKSRSVGTSRSSLKNPAAGITKIFKDHTKVAILGVLCRQLSQLQIIYGYFVEPAFQHGCTLWIDADQGLKEISTLASSSRFHDKPWRYPWTIERLVYLTELGQDSKEISVPVTGKRWRQLLHKVLPGVDNSGPLQQNLHLDQQQLGAVNAGDGVVQIIAPAGSGKTTVLIERVKELQKRGTPAHRILCMSFNRDAMVEIRQRLVQAGIEGVVVRSFHGMGLAILKNEGQLRKSISGIEDTELQQLIAQAAATEMEAESDRLPKISFKTADARNAISEFKLASMITPEEAIHRATNSCTRDRIAACLYDLYQTELDSRGFLDFDDLIAQSVYLLQTNYSVRKQWQKKFDRVLVDEYQDIEPSQALLVGILAAPQDSLFCVGDEDQCIYAWRRATVQRIIELDQVYPGLERHALTRNYRCGSRITNASRRLVEHNRQRFRKPLKAGAKIKGEIVAVSCESRATGADLVAHLISDAIKEKAVVLARSSRLLMEIKAACRRIYNSDPDIELATVHAAKGREWDRVILFAVDEGQMPHAQAVYEGKIEDERRLFYVALTRAKLRLEIVCTEKKESRFLNEAGLLVRRLKGR